MIGKPPAASSDSEDDSVYVLASQQYEMLYCGDDKNEDGMVLNISSHDDCVIGLQTSPVSLHGSDVYPISPNTERRYDEMEEEDFFVDNLLGDGKNGSESSTVAGGIPTDTDDAVADYTKGRFGTPVSEEDILKAIDGAIPASTRKTTKWAARTWDSWRDYRTEAGSEDSTTSRWYQQ